MSLGFLQIGTSEMLFIVFIAILLFGGKKLPELARGLGRGIREFKDASESIKREISDQINNFEKDLDVESAILDDAEIERQRQLAKAQNENKESEKDDSQSENQVIEGESLEEVREEFAEKKYTDPRLNAIFTPPTGVQQYNTQPDYVPDTKDVEEDKSGEDKSN